MTEALKEKLEGLKHKLKDAQTNLKDVDFFDHCAKNAGNVSNVRSKWNFRLLKGHLGKVYALHWTPKAKSPDSEGRYQVISASQDGKLLVWDTRSSSKVNVVNLRTSWVMTVAMSVDAVMAACGGLDNQITVYSLQGEKKSMEIGPHEGYLSTVRFLDNNNKVLSSSGDASCALWDVQKGIQLAKFQGHTSDVMSISLKPSDENVFVSGSVDFTAKLWDLRQKNFVREYVLHDRDINTVAFFPNGNLFATGADDSKVALTDIRVGLPLATFSKDIGSSSVTSVDFSHSGRILFVGLDDYRVLAFDVLNGNPVVFPRSHTNRVSCLSVHPEGFALATGSWDNNLRIWM